MLKSFVASENKIIVTMISESSMILFISIKIKSYYMNDYHYNESKITNIVKKWAQITFKLNRTFTAVMNTFYRSLFAQSKLTLSFLQENAI